MTPLGNLVYAVSQVLDFAVNILFFLLLARVVISWVKVDAAHPAIQALYSVTEPFLLPIRRALYRYTGASAIDFSPIVAFLVLMFLQSFVVRTLFQLAQTLTV